MSGQGGGAYMGRDRVVTTRDGHATPFNAQSDKEAAAYRAGWADALSEVRDELVCHCEDAAFEERVKQTPSTSPIAAQALRDAARDGEVLPYLVRKWLRDRADQIAERSAR